MKKIITILMLLFFIASSVAYSHSGRTNKEGCHNDRKSDTFHCH
jgi:hypothetical protein